MNPTSSGSSSAAEFYYQLIKRKREEEESLESSKRPCREEEKAEGTIEFSKEVSCLELYQQQQRQFKLHDELCAMELLNVLVTAEEDPVIDNSHLRDCLNYRVICEPLTEQITQISEYIGSTFFAIAVKRRFWETAAFLIKLYEFTNFDHSVHFFSIIEILVYSIFTHKNDLLKLLSYNENLKNNVFSMHFIEIQTVKKIALELNVPEEETKRALFLIMKHNIFKNVPLPPEDSEDRREYYACGTKFLELMESTLEKRLFNLSTKEIYFHEELKNTSFSEKENFLKRMPKKLLDVGHFEFIWNFQSKHLKLYYLLKAPPFESRNREICSLLLQGVGPRNPQELNLFPLFFGYLKLILGGNAPQNEEFEIVSFIKICLEKEWLNLAVYTHRFDIIDFFLNSPVFDVSLDHSDCYYALETFRLTGSLKAKRTYMMHLLQYPHRERVWKILHCVADILGLVHEGFLTEIKDVICRLANENNPGIGFRMHFGITIDDNQYRNFVTIFAHHLARNEVWKMFMEIFTVYPSIPYVLEGQEEYSLFNLTAKDFKWPIFLKLLKENPKAKLDDRKWSHAPVWYAALFHHWNLVQLILNQDPTVRLNRFSSNSAPSPVELCLFNRSKPGAGSEACLNHLILLGAKLEIEYYNSVASKIRLAGKEQFRQLVFTIQTHFKKIYTVLYHPVGDDFPSDDAINSGKSGRSYTRITAALPGDLKTSIALLTLKKSLCLDNIPDRLLLDKWNAYVAYKQAK